MDAIDRKIKQSLKQWASGQRLPANGRARLMVEIARQNSKSEKPPTFLTVNIPNEIFSWVMVYSCEKGVTALRLVS